MPVPVYIYSGTPADLEPHINTAVQAWNDIDSSYFEMQIVGYTTTKDAIPNAVVIGFDPTLCPDGGDPCLYGATSAGAVSVSSDWDGYQIPQATVFADAEPWRSFPGRPNPLWVMMHEMGHVLGIVHPDVNGHGLGGQGCGQPFLDATMECCDRQDLATDVGTLELDDIAAATSLYPKWKYTVEVVDHLSNPIEGAAVWMEGTCFPHDGLDENEGGMVLGDIPSCLVGDGAPSDTYHPELTYATGVDGRTGVFRVMHDSFCFTVVADGFANAHGCQDLPAPGNYITTITLNRPPVCDANGPYTAECGLGVALDGGGSSDPEGQALSYLWTGPFVGSPVAGQTPNVVFPAPTGNKQVSLEVDDGLDPSQCLAPVTVQDTLAPSMTPPGPVTAECAAPEGTPVALGTPAVHDICDGNVDTTNDAPALFPLGATNVTWTATDDDGNQTTDTQTVTVVDTLPPVIACNSPPTIVPPDAPIAFTATATDQCQGSIQPTITGFDCYKYTRKGRQIDKGQSCAVTISDDSIVIYDSGGVGDNIVWNAEATDANGNTSTVVCSVVVANPGK